MDATAERPEIPKILISEFMDGDAVAWLSDRTEVRFDPDLVENDADLLAAAAAVDALIVRNRTQVRGALLDTLVAGGTRIVGRLGVGLDNIDVDRCAEAGIDVIPATGANAASVAEYVIAATLLLRRGAYGHSASVLAGDWPRTALIGREVAGARMGLVGFGGIAREVAGRARGLAMRPLASDPLLPAEDPAWSAHGCRPVDLAELLAVSDVVSLHVPLTAATRHLIGAAELAAMKPGTILINTARGGIVDEAALAEALIDGRLAGAALDVFETEPLAAGSALAGAPNLIATPHIAGVTGEANRRVSALIARRVAARLGLD